MSSCIVVVDNKVDHVEMFQDKRVCCISVNGRINCVCARRECCEHCWNIGWFVCNVIYDSIVDILIVVGEIHGNSDKVVGRHDPQWHERNKIGIIPVVVFLHNFGFRFRRFLIVYQPSRDVRCPTRRIKHSLIYISVTVNKVLQTHRSHDRIVLTGVLIHFD